MKKIVIDARESGTSTGRYADKLIEYLHELKPEFNITVITKPHRLDYLKKVAPSFEILEANYKEFTFNEQLALKRRIEASKPDLVHFTMTQQPVLYKGRVVTTMHDLTTARFKNPDKNPIVFNSKQQVYKWVIKQAAKKSLYIFAPSNFVKADLVQFTHVSPSKIVVTYEAADYITDDPKPVKELSGKQFIMYTGRPTPHKNLDRLVKAFKLLQETHTDLYLVLVGQKDSNYKATEKRVNEQGIQNVVFTGFVPDNQLKWLYEHCAAYVIPSLSEGFGLTGLEAMAQGAMVISSDATCLPEIYGDAALYFYPYHTKTIADTISEGLTNKSLRTKLIAEGKKQVKKYSWRRMAQQTLETYEKALGDV